MSNKIGKIKKVKNKLLKFMSIGVTGALIAAPLASCSSYLTFESAVQLVVSDNTSTLADQSFSQSSYDGIRSFFSGLKTENSNIEKELPEAFDKSIKENNGLWKKPGTTTISRIASYKYAFEDGAKVVVATGYNQQDGLQQITSRKSNYKLYKESFENNAFVFVDGTMNAGDAAYDSDPYNVSSVSYRADDGSFLTGISTAVFLNLNQDYFKGKDGNLAVSSFVGLALPSTLNFMSGFRLGIHYWNKVLQPLIPTIDGTKTTLPVKWVSSTNNNDISSYMSGSFNANEPKVGTLVKGMRANGANAIFPIAGPQTALAVGEIVSDSSTKSIVIGVDTAQENTASLEAPLPNGSHVGTGKIIQFSSVKNLKGTTDGILNAIVNGYNGKTADNGGTVTHPSKDEGASVATDSETETKLPQDLNGFYGLGWNNVGTVTNAGVGVSDAGLKYLINPNFTQWSKSISENTKDGVNTEGKTTLEYLLKNQVAKQLVASDPVITQYNNLLSGKFNTSTGTTTGDTIKQDENGVLAKQLELIKNADGMNGPDAKHEGNWTIYNNAGDVNNFLSVQLSDIIQKITSSGSDVTYPVPSPNATYVGQSDDKEHIDFYNSLTKSSMFFRKN